MKTFLKVILIILMSIMLVKIITTSLQSNLFEEWATLVKIPWMDATLWDFYANVFCIFLWILYKEKNHLTRLSWLILLIVLGSVATIAYILIQLFKLKKEEALMQVFIKQNK